MQQIEVNSDAWFSLLGEIAANYADGELISHVWLKKKFGLVELTLEQFDTVSDFIEGLQLQQFSYMSLVDNLRWQLLENEKLYIRNVRGDGYEVVKPQEQTSFGFSEFVKDMKKAMREADLIINNVRSVSSEQQSKDNDIRAKYGILKQMLSGIKYHR